MSSKELEIRAESMYGPKVSVAKAGTIIKLGGRVWAVILESDGKPAFGLSVSVEGGSVWGPKGTPSIHSAALSAYTAEEAEDKARLFVNAASIAKCASRISDDVFFARVPDWVRTELGDADWTEEDFLLKVRARFTQGDLSYGETWRWGIDSVVGPVESRD